MSAKRMGIMLLLLLPAAWATAQENFLQRLLEGRVPQVPGVSGGAALPAEVQPEGAVQRELSQPLPSGSEGAAGAHNSQALPPPTAEEVLPEPGERVLVPLAGVGIPGQVQFHEQGDRISLVVRDASLSYVLSLLAERRGLNIVAANGIDALVSITLYNQTVEEALTAILSVANYTWTTHNGIIYVTSMAQAVSLPPELQGRRIQVFPLDYISAQDLLPTVESFLSPVGQAFVSSSDPQDNRRTQEALVVEDIPHALERIAAFVHQMDQAPRQVLIEAQILQVELGADRKHGVNFHLLKDENVNLVNVMGSNTALNTVAIPETGTAGGGDDSSGDNSGAVSGPNFFATVNTRNLLALVRLLKETTDAKTLASPRLLVLNEQRARMQIGEKLGYQVVTTTETSSQESVAFLDVGVVLEITPRITRDNRILLQVRPKVSDGQVNPATGVPDEQTTELETNVILDDGYGLVIGGLIRETDSVRQSKVPYLGDLYLLGKLFQSEEVTKSRREVIVVLIPRIFPYACDYAAYEEGNVVRTETQLFEGPLLRKDRHWAAKFPDAVTNPRVLRLPPVGQVHPYPVTQFDHAATPQPQRQYPIPQRPGPAVTSRAGQGPPTWDAHPGDPIPYDLPPSGPVLFGGDATVAPTWTPPDSTGELPPAPPTPPAGP